MIARIYISLLFSLLIASLSVNFAFSNEVVSSVLSRDIPLDWDENGDGLFDDISNYQNSGSITSRIYLPTTDPENESDLTSSGDALAAFVDGEQRGFAIASEVPAPLGGGYSFLILVYSNAASGETITLQFYDSSENAVYNILESYDFTSDMIVGSVLFSEVLTLGELIDDGDGGGSCDDIDDDDICDENDDCIGSFDECGICNGDNLSCADCAGIPNGNTELDECGVCGGNGIGEDFCDCDNNVFDCLGVCGGTALQDCSGSCEGDNYFDECGVCGGDNSSCDINVQGYINQETGWSFYQSPTQAFYGFESIEINGVSSQGSNENWAPGSLSGNCIENPYTCDVVGAFINGTCVGWNYVDSSEITQTTVQVQGYYNAPNFQDLTQDYCQDGDMPSFYIFDSSNQEIYLLANEQSVNPWSNLEFYYLLGTTNAIYESGGCIEEFAVNYDDTAEIYNPFDPCFYYQDINLQSGWNIFSLSILPNENDIALFNILSPISDEISLVLDERGSGIFKDQTGEWIDNIGEWQNSEGYLIKVDTNQTLELTTNQLIELPLSIDLDSGWNIISYPIQSENGGLIEEVLSELIVAGDLYTVFSETGDIYVPSYITGSDPVNSIGSMLKDEGYYVKVLDDIVLSIIEPSGDNLLVNNNNENLYRTGHFNPVWDGNPSNPMTITVDSFLWDGISLQEGDEIGVFDGDICVGAGLVTADGYINDSNNQIKVSKDDGSGNGYTEFNSISFRVWKESLAIDIDASIDNWTDISGNTINQVFEALTTPRLNLQVYPPSSISNFTLVPGQTSIDLSWSRPAIGDYNIYDSDNNPSSAVLFSILRDGENVSSNLDSENFMDLNLNYNTTYSYYIEATSIVGSSLSSNISSLTISGVPTLNINANVNQNDLFWSDPINSGNDDSINYKIERFWVVGDFDYNEIIIDDLLVQNFSDLGLLNSSSFSYRIKSFNSSGSSEWSEYIESSTLSGSDSIQNIINFNVSAEQLLSPPDNVVNLSWSPGGGPWDYFNIYEKNLLLISVNEEIFIDSNLETSSIRQYVITSVLNGIESLPSQTLVIETLPELAPDAPGNLNVNGGQNQSNLDWDIVVGYGEPIGGSAVSYNIYRESLGSFSNIESISFLDNTTQSNYIDLNLNDNTYYCYAVAGVNSEGLEGEKSNLICTGTLSQLPASSPENLVAIGDDQQVFLIWNSSEGSPTIFYQIYRYGEYIGQTSLTNYNDVGLQKNTTYSYYVVATNELGSSSLSDTSQATTSNQSNLLSANVPEDLSVELPEVFRASEFLDAEASISWSSKSFSESEANSNFELVYSGNPYQPMTLVVEQVLYQDINVPDGSIIAVFDGEKCVGKSQLPLPGGALTVSKDDGTGNGFLEGNLAYFKVWNSDTNSILTTTAAGNLFFEGLGLQFIDLSVNDDIYNLYRNGSLLESNISITSYVDDELESEMNYSYQVSAENILGQWSESNPSGSAEINTFNYVGSTPEFTDDFRDSLHDGIDIDEDTSYTLDLTNAAIDPDGDVVNYLVENGDSLPIECVVDGNTLTITPAPDFWGTYEIKLIAYDDYDPYESNTFIDEFEFEIRVNSINDPPLIINQIDDINFDEDLYFNQDYSLANLDDYIVDVDNLIMSEEDLSFELTSSNENFIVFVSNDDENPILSFYINPEITDYEVTEVNVLATDQNNLQVELSFDVIITEVVICVPENDFDGDGVCDNADPCPFDNPNDSDADGSCDSDDICPGEDDFIDTDFDEIVDCLDSCPNDFDNDIDGDGVCGDVDICPEDFNDDSDGDGSCDSVDICPDEDDFLDTDIDDIPDCLDSCPNDFENDSDGDGVCGDVDVCPGFDDNLDTDLDGTADGCDICPFDFDNDLDGDGVCGDIDICPEDFNDDSDGDGSCDSIDICPGENDFLDTDNDGVVDCLDSCPQDFSDDSDGDGICDSSDVCPGFNDNIDNDLDGTADGCDICPFDFDNDSDGDGVCGDVDECPGFDDNLDQDGDEIADGCDSCPFDFDNDLDGDGVCGNLDICPGFDDNLDLDQDLIPDGCDTCPNDFDNDLDGDGICGDVDACPNDFDNDLDGDGICGDVDACPNDFDNDLDGDGICGDVDACPNDFDNDLDGDGICGNLDECPNDFDNDLDSDGVCGDIDTCPGFDDNIDTDIDGIADGCDACPNDFDNDLDGDGICGDVDACPGFDDNIDTDLDEIADGCDVCPYDFDNDLDGDGICGNLDECPNDFDNDLDGDGVCGDLDACPGFDDNIDTDLDEIADGCDVCPYDFDNDLDGDEICGDVDVCPNDFDNDSDNDGVCGDFDQCPGYDDNLNADLDGIPDGCDPCPYDFDNDSDGDGVCGDIDACPGFDDNIDTDLDGIADGCDSCPNDFDNDLDGDDICGDVDTCPNDFDNDLDGDDICGDVDTCPNDFDNDLDGDGICGDVDACPNDFDNDLDGDGICDDVDDCVGYFDECGACNGQGIIDGFCDCLGNVFDNCGVCDGDNSSCSYSFNLADDGSIIQDELITISDDLNLQIVEGTLFNLDSSVETLDLNIYNYFEDDLPVVYDVFELSGDTYSFEPYGLELSEPATISISYDQNSRSDYSVVKLENEQDESWERIENSVCSNGECIVDISSFGLFSVAKIVDNSYFESCFAHPLEQNYNSFSFIGLEDSDSSTLGSDLEVLYNNAILDDNIFSIEFNINWCSNAWVDLNEDGIWDSDENTGEFSCQEQYVVDDSRIESWTFFDELNWDVSIINYGSFSEFSAIYQGALDSLNNPVDSLSPGCGFLANIQYLGNIHSVTGINWSSIYPENPNNLGFSYVPFENDYLSAEIPASLILNQNYPNPFNPITNIEFVLPKNSYVSLIVYDVNGRFVSKLISDYMLSGSYSVLWDAKNSSNESLPSGIYIYQLNSSELSITKKMTLIR